MNFKHKAANRFNEVMTALLLIGILAMVNLIGNTRFHRFDLTARGEYTISDATRNILSRLDDVITVRAYFSGNIPPMQQAVLRQIKDILSEYKVYSRGNLRVEYIDPMGDEELQQSLRMMNIPEIRLNTFERDKAQVISCYMGIGIFYEDRKAVLPVIINLSNFEYDLTASIRKVSSRELPVVGILQGFGVPDLHREMMMLKSSLEQQYELRGVELTKERGLDPDITTLLIPGPEERMPGWALYHIDQFLMGGGRVVAMLNAYTLGEGMRAVRNQTGLEKLLAHHGLKIRDGLVADAQCSQATFSQGFMSFSMPYLFFPRIGGAGLNRESPITAPLESITFPWVSALEIEAGDKEVVRLASTSEESWLQTGFIQLNPNARIQPPGEDALGSMPVAAILSGVFSSKYAESGMPPTEGELDDATLITAEDTTKKSEFTHLLVIADSDFISEQHIRSDRGNLVFLQNAVDWMTLDPELINIRSRSIVDYPLTRLDEWEKEAGERGRAVVERRKDMIKYAASFGMPAFIILLGIIWHFINKARIIRNAERIKFAGMSVSAGATKPGVENGGKR